MSWLLLTRLSPPGDLGCLLPPEASLKSLADLHGDVEIFTLGMRGATPFELSLRFPNGTLTGY
jgi:hypothetical protein